MYKDKPFHEELREVLIKHNVQLKGEKRQSNNPLEGIYPLSEREPKYMKQPSKYTEEERERLVKLLERELAKVRKARLAADADSKTIPDPELGEGRWVTLKNKQRVFIGKEGKLKAGLNGEVESLGGGSGGKEAACGIKNYLGTFFGASEAYAAEGWEIMKQDGTPNIKHQTTDTYAETGAFSFPFEINGSRQVGLNADGLLDWAGRNGAVIEVYGTLGKLDDAYASRKDSAAETVSRNSTDVGNFYPDETVEEVAVLDFGDIFPKELVEFWIKQEKNNKNLPKETVFIIWKSASKDPIHSNKWVGVEIGDAPYKERPNYLIYDKTTEYFTINLGGERYGWPADRDKVGILKKLPNGRFIVTKK